MSDPSREALRRMLLARRDSTSQEMLELASDKIRWRLQGSSVLDAATSVGAYYAIGSEVRTLGIMQDILDSGRTLMLPSVLGDTMQFRIVTSMADLVRGRFDIMEPRARCLVGQPDILLVPAVGITTEGIRLGYGHGYYDKYLQRQKCRSVGVTLEKQVVKSIPFNSLDVMVDWIVTEDWIRGVTV